MSRAAFALLLALVACGAEAADEPRETRSAVLALPEGSGGQARALCDPAETLVSGGCTLSGAAILRGSWRGNASGYPPHWTCAAEAPDGEGTIQAFALCQP